MKITLERENNLKDDELGKIHIRNIRGSFITTCPVCGYSFRREMDPKNRRNKGIRCPMCGYKWNRLDLVDKNHKFPHKK